MKPCSSLKNNLLLKLWRILAQSGLDNSVIQPGEGRQAGQEVESRHRNRPYELAEHRHRPLPWRGGSRWCRLQTSATECRNRNIEANLGDKATSAPVLPAISEGDGHACPSTPCLAGELEEGHLARQRLSCGELPGGWASCPSATSITACGELGGGRASCAVSSQYVPAGLSRD